MQTAWRWIGLSVAALGLLAVVVTAAGSHDLEPDGDVDLEDFEYFAACLSVSGPLNPPLPSFQVCVDVFDADADTDVDLADLAALQQAFTGRRLPARVPPPTYTLDNIGIHDPASERYDADCISCHGTRRDEVALDGVTPVAHAKMMGVLGEAFQGNELCLYCHTKGADFVNMSAGGLRRQVDMWSVECVLCHMDSGPPETPRFYMRPGP